MKGSQIKKLFDYDYKEWCQERYKPEMMTISQYPGQVVTTVSTSSINGVSFNSASTCNPVYSGYNAQLSFNGFNFQGKPSVQNNLKTYLGEKGEEYSLQDLQEVLQYTQDEAEKKVIQDYIKPRLINLWSE